MDIVQNVTARIEGTDAATSIWALSQHPPVAWIPPSRMPIGDSGVAPSSVSAQEVAIPLLLSAAGLAEQLASYKTTLNITTIGQSQVSYQDTFLVPVHFYVSVKTYASTSRWGTLNGSGTHATCLDIPEPSQVQTRVGEASVQQFTACDVEGLPVNHPLPSASDQRMFAAQLVRVGSDGAPGATSTTPQDVEYVSAGIYDVTVVIGRDAPTGLYRLTLALGEEPIARHIDVQVICPKGLIELADGVSCGCEAGQYLEGVVCSPCTAGTYSGNGSSSCTDCSEGTFSFAGAAACEACPAGTFTPDTGQAVCMPWCAHEPDTSNMLAS